MTNEQAIVIELVNAIESVCAQVSMMNMLTGRHFSQERLQVLIDTRVEEFKQLYTEIPKDAKFTIDNHVAGVLFVSSNEVFRDYANKINVENKQVDQLINTDALGSALH